MEKEIDIKSDVLHFTSEEAEQVATENFGLIHHIISTFSYKDIEYDELFDAGQFGYAKAIKTFDKNKNILFSTYACNCIKNEILLYLKKEQKHLYYDISLQKDVSNNDGKTLLLEDVLTDEKYNSNRVDEDLMKESTKKTIMEAINKLTDEEQFIILHRFGIDGNKEMLQKDIASEINMSQANISKLEKSCLKKLRFFLNQKL